MKKYPVIKFLVWIALVALTAPDVSACESENALHQESFHDEESHHEHGFSDTSGNCHSENTHINKLAHPDQPCPDKDDCSGCHCPACAVVPFHHHFGFLTSVIENTLVSPLDVTTQNRGFYFDRHLPEAVDLPIWQPPKW
jgi:hypothetical protein